MKESISDGLVWLAVAIPITVGIYVTGNLTPLWAFLFPYFYTTR